MLWIDRYAAVETQAVANASKMIVASSRDRPLPPNLSPT